MGAALSPEADRSLLILSDHAAVALARAAFRLDTVPTVTTNVDDAVRALVLRRHKTLLVHLPCVGLTLTRLLSLFADHDACEHTRIVILCDTPEALPVARRGDPRLHLLAGPPERLTDTILAAAINPEEPQTFSESSTFEYPSQHVEEWALDAVLLRWRAARTRDLPGRTVALVALCESLARLPVDLREAPRVLTHIAPRVLKAWHATPRRINPDRTPGYRLIIQRLACTWCQLLSHVLHATDRRDAYEMDETQRLRLRLWLLLHAIDMLRGLIELDAAWGHRVPEHVWLKLHDLHTYVAVRLRPQHDTTALDAACSRRLARIERRYIQALLLGIASHQTPGTVQALGLDARSGEWARETTLHRAVRSERAPGWWIVETPADAPPRYRPGPPPLRITGLFLHLPPEAFDTLTPEAARIEEEVPA